MNRISAGIRATLIQRLKDAGGFAAWDEFIEIYTPLIFELRPILVSNLPTPGTSVRGLSGGCEFGLEWHHSRHQQYSRLGQEYAGSIPEWSGSRRVDRLPQGRSDLHVRQEPVELDVTEGSLAVIGVNAKLQAMEGQELKSIWTRK